MKLILVIGFNLGTPNSIESTDHLSLAIMERIYCYCAFQYHYAQRQKKDIAEPGFIVDLASMIHTLDTLMKQPLHARLRFLFDLHDLDGDTFLSKTELKAVMDSLLEIFQKSNHSQNRAQAEHEEEKYFKAVSSFLAAALQMGNSKSDTPKGKPDDKRKPHDLPFLLSFNEFLLAILSQSVFVEYFERKWILKKQGDLIELEWHKM